MPRSPLPACPVAASTEPRSAAGIASRVPSLAGRTGGRGQGRAWAAALSCAVAASAATGCTRGHYRTQADRATYDAIIQKASDPRWPTRDIGVYAPAPARFHDPFDPDRPPMPPDDPTSHRLMHRVDGKHGYLKWGKNGGTPFVQNPNWVLPLPFDRDGVPKMDLQGAVDTARLHSRDYQTNLEDVYLSALDVTFERFRFDSQYFFADSFNQSILGRDRAGSGGESSNIIRNDADLTAQRFYANGGQLVINLANSIVWQIAGPDTSSSQQILGFTLFQPLLRNFSRARNLERLTLSERTLLNNVRAMERYRQAFFVNIAAGIDAGQGPQRTGGFLGGAGLDGFSGVGTGGFGRIGTTQAIGGGGGGAGGAGAGQANGFLGRLQELQQIRNQTATVAQLRQSLAQLQASYEANRIDLFQVDQARQALFNTQSQLLSAEVQYRDNLDVYKLSLGIPPQVELKLDEESLKPFELLSAANSDLQDRLRNALEQLRTNPAGVDWTILRKALDGLDAAAQAQAAALDEALAGMEAKRKARTEGLADLIRRPEFLETKLDQRMFDPAQVDRKTAAVQQEAADLRTRLTENLNLIRGVAREPDSVPTDARLGRLLPELDELNGLLLEMNLVHAKAKLQALDLIPIDLDSDRAIELARWYRLDWMNARAALVDSWRLIEFNANALRSDLNVTMAGDISTTNDRFFNFKGTTGALRMGIQWDAPLTRVAERNVYRQSLIDYQRARRSYLDFEDRLAQGLRATVRRLNRDRINFELRRSAIEVAISQVDVARLRLTQPPKPNAVDPLGQQLGATTARDLISALTDLLAVQNDFLSVHTSYQVQRMVLDRDLGTLRLDDRGMWIDPGRFDYALPPEAANCGLPWAVPPPVGGTFFDRGGLRLDDASTGEEVPAAPADLPLPAADAAPAPAPAIIGPVAPQPAP